MRKAVNNLVGLLDC